MSLWSVSLCVLIAVFGGFQETAALFGCLPGVLGLFFRLIDRQQHLTWTRSPVRAASLWLDRLAGAAAHPVLHGIFHVEDQGYAHPVFIKKACISFTLRVALDGTFRLRTYIRVLDIGKVILALNVPLGPISLSCNSHAGGHFRAQFTEPAAFLFRQAAGHLRFFCQAL